MPDIVHSMRSAARRRIDQIEENTRQRADQLIESARGEAEAQKQRILFDGRAKLNRLQALIEQQATIRALQAHADARQSLVEAALQKAQGSLSALREKDNYGGIFTQLVQEALDAVRPSLLTGQHIILHIDPRDRKNYQALLKNLADNPKVMEDLVCLGGCEAETEDGLVAVKNTIESRYERALPAVRQDLGIFFEERIAAD